MSFATPYREKQLHQLVQKLGLPEKPPLNWHLLDVALTHPTAGLEENYERLEFVGDAVIKLAAAAFLFREYPTVSEGELSAMRGALVSDRTLAAISDRYGLDRYLLMSTSTLNDPLGKETRTAAVLEALLAALYLSTGNLQLIHPWLDPHLRDFTQQIRQDPALYNYKGALQGWTQNHWQTLPDYRVHEAQQKYGDPERFVAEVWIKGDRWGEGKGKSKKAAEQAAAEVAYLALQNAQPPES